LLLLFGGSVTAQNGLQFTNNSVLRVGDAGNLIKLMRKPGTDSIFQLKIFNLVDTTWDYRYKISDVSTTWSLVTGKPSTFTPSTHNHDWSGNDITNKPTIPTNTNQLTNGAGFLVAADISGKQNTLVSGTNIKTINGSTVLGSGDLVVSGAAAWGSVTGTLSNQSDLNNALAGKSATGHTHVKSDVTGYQGYSINVQALTSSPTDAQTVYFGMLPKAPTTSANISKVYIRIQLII
jgi:hypothetical protein